jgi:hypothetical protein
LIFGSGSRDFPSVHNIKTFSGTLIVYPIGTGADSVERGGGVVNWPGHKADHSFPSIFKVNNAWWCTSTSFTSLSHSLGLIKCRETLPLSECLFCIKSLYKQT